MKKETLAETSLASNGLPIDSAWLFPEYEFSTMDDKRFANVIIERILDRGSLDQVRWVLACYGKRGVEKWVRQCGYRRLPRKNFEYWRWVFGIKRYRKQPWEKI
ncbi:MAG: hypothetical protein AAB261_04895 [Chloroflexota bacterium]